MKAINIQWDIDESDDVVLLPDEIDIPDDIVDVDDISDHISNVTGFCHKGFQIKYDPVEFAEKYLGVKLRWYQKLYMRFVKG